ncbi:hypothetical protein H696_03090 [Fonticula alba]|uniref:Peptidase M28 domain-containing protein n=1 Tax=Fonticula alba TaxID=691883 RepID=A0A058Z8V2_FONAL|nr:hypothetical protein H696_03090 [Fonticula alba]KCV70739.1 hypothetical protein H696_03090 [Fonticula alba]|eukprot:XP_009495255.1 hypothetical protein H696_03090 [Fonticula alba]
MSKGYHRMSRRIQGTDGELSSLVNAGIDARATLEDGSVLVFSDLDGPNDDLTTFTRSLGRLAPGTRVLRDLGHLGDDENIIILEKGHDAEDMPRLVNTLRSEYPTAFRPIFADDEQRYIITSYQSSDVLDRFLEQGLSHESLVVPTQPIHPQRSSNLKRFAHLFDRAPNPRIARLLDRVTQEDLHYFATMLSGEHPQSTQHTRHSKSADSLFAGDFVQQHFENNGFDTWREKFMPNYCSNVIGDYRNATMYPDQYVIISGHLDDREANINDPAARAPGANDDGSGSAAMMTIAKVLGEADVSFRRALRLVTWCGEEQGLYGSKFHANNAVADGMDIFAMIQGDMLAVIEPNAKPAIGLVTRYTDPVLTSLVRDIVGRYLPDAQIFNQTACCSDHQPFFEVGYPSAGFVEPIGYVGDPHYHKVTDLVERPDYSIEQLQLITRAILACLLELAELA